MDRRSFLKLPTLLPLVDFGSAWRSETHHFGYEFVIGTSMDLLICSPSSRVAEGACRTVLEEIGRLRSVLDTRDPHSEVSRLETSNGVRGMSGDLAEVRVYNRPLTDAERLQVETELRDSWFKPGAPEVPCGDPLVELREELLSPRGPFWPGAEERLKLIPSEARARLARRHHDTRPSRELADKLVDDRLAAPFTADANDFPYQFDSSRDYNPSPALERIQAALLAVNSADDERDVGAR